MGVQKSVSLHGKRAYISKDDELGSRNGFVAGGVDKPSIAIPGAPDTVALFTDFLGDTIPAELNSVEGDTGNSQALQPGTNGVLRMLGSNTATPAASQVNELNTGSLNWKANQGPGAYAGRLRMAARLKLESVARDAKRQHVFVGFTDVTTAEMPAYDTGAGVISAASDYVGIMYSPSGVKTGWAGAAGKSVAGDSGDLSADLGVAPLANTYDTVEIEVVRGPSTPNGVARFFVNGSPRGAIDYPVKVDVGLTPVIATFQQDTGARYVDVDYIAVSAPRDTGL